MVLRLMVYIISCGFNTNWVSGKKMSECTTSHVHFAIYQRKIVNMTRILLYFFPTAYVKTCMRRVSSLSSSMNISIGSMYGSLSLCQKLILWEPFVSVKSFPCDARFYEKSFVSSQFFWLFFFVLTNAAENCRVKGCPFGTIARLF